MIASGLDARLYWMPHPDNALEILGLLLVTDRDGQPRLHGLVPVLGARRERESVRVRVLQWPADAGARQRRKPSINPDDIRKEMDWHSILMPLP